MKKLTLKHNIATAAGLVVGNLSYQAVMLGLENIDVVSAFGISAIVLVLLNGYAWVKTKKA